MFFLLRDVIENIKVYIYLLMASPNHYLNYDENTFDNSEFLIRIEQLKGTKKLDFDFKKMLNEHSELSVYNDEFSRIEKITKICNNSIHKNGYKTMKMLFLKNVNETKLLAYMFYILKLFFSIFVSFDGKNISTSDYIDFLNIGETPIENCQHWIAPIYKKFIKSEFSGDEINKIRKNTYMEI